jgi:hypothetical protein
MNARQMIRETGKWSLQTLLRYDMDSANINPTSTLVKGITMKKISILTEISQALSQHSERKQILTEHAPAHAGLVSLTREEYIAVAGAPQVVNEPRQ